MVHLRHNRETHFRRRFDAKLSETTKEALPARIMEGFDLFFGFRPAKIVFADACGGNKLSYHVSVSGYRMKMKMQDVKAQLVRLGLDKNRPFNGAIYSAYLGSRGGERGSEPSRGGAQLHGGLSDCTRACRGSRTRAFSRSTRQCSGSCGSQTCCRLPSS